MREGIGMQRLIVVLLCAALVGCSGARYRHPVTGATAGCVDRTLEQGLLWGVIGGVAGGFAYADCKNTLEAQGFIRARDDSVLLRQPTTAHVVDCTAASRGSANLPFAVRDCIQAHEQLGYLPFDQSFPAVPSPVPPGIAEGGSCDPRATLDMTTHCPEMEPNR
jgi:hypothetical protein